MQTRFKKMSIIHIFTIRGQRSICNDWSTCKCFRVVNKITQENDGEGNTRSKTHLHVKHLIQRGVTESKTLGDG